MSSFNFNPYKISFNTVGSIWYFGFTGDWVGIKAGFLRPPFKNDSCIIFWELLLTSFSFALGSRYFIFPKFKKKLLKFGWAFCYLISWIGLLFLFGSVNTSKREKSFFFAEVLLLFRSVIFLSKFTNWLFFELEFLD